jgi:DNA gyrase/topoisomerase IV subunit B
VPLEDIVREKRGYTGQLVDRNKRKKRTLLRVVLLADEQKITEKSVERLMGTKPEARFTFIQERAEFAGDAALDV